MRFVGFWPVVVPIISSLLLAVGPVGQGRAASVHAFIVSATDGYGVEDCLGERGDCGRIVADAWCEAHGRGPAISFGRAEDVTGAISLARNGAAAEPPYVVTCGE